MMKNIAVKLSIPFFVIMTTLSSAKTVKAVDKLPLKHGTYVMESALNDMKNRAILNSADTFYYDGKGLNSDRLRSTIIHVRKRGNVYFITEKLEGLDAAGGDETYSSRCTITIKSRTSFSISDIKINDEPPDKKISTYRWVQD
jgi:hypothetical protein